MQTLTNDPYIKKFLQEVTPNEQLVTLKELIYIGIKVVNNSLTNPQQLNNHFANKENQNKRNNFGNAHRVDSKNIKSDKKKTKNYESKSQLNKYKHTSSQGRIESSLLRQISKIRTQLQSLTNKVYDHCFQEQENCPSESSMSLNNDQQIQQAHGFHPSNVPTFSANQAQTLLANAFQKQSNNFFVNGDVLDAKNKNVRQSKIEDLELNRQKRVLSRHHLDDTQIRKALYSQNAQEDENISRAKAKSVIVQKKQPVHYFQQLNPKQTKQAKQQKKSRKIPNFDNNYIKTVKSTYNKNVKSKIKPLVQRDRLRYQQNVRKQEFAKGYNKYEYSDNEFDQDESDDFSSNYQGSPQVEPQYENEQRSSQRGVQFSQNKSNQKFQFYGSNEGKQKRSDIFKEDFVQAQKEEEGSDNINIGDNSSSFSQFSISGSSKREVGKISRRAQH